MSLSTNVSLRMMLGWILLAHQQLSESVKINDNAAALTTVENLARLVAAMAFTVGQEQARESSK